MRITNTMITKNSMYNINGNKVSVDAMNSQMSTQKKISKASEDPVIAIRSLSLRTTLSEVNQYYEKNIPDAESWLSITEDALENMKTILGDVYEQCTYGANDSLNQDDRNAILTNLKALRDQVYAECNADNAGRTVFTGYKTNKTLTFTEDTQDTTYKIDEDFSYTDIEEKNYYANTVTVPTSADQVSDTTLIPTADNGDMPEEVTNKRIRLSYGQTSTGSNTMDSFSYTYTNDDGKQQRVTYSQTTDSSGVEPGEDGYVATYTVKDEIATYDTDGNIIKDANGDVVYDTVTPATTAYTMKSMSYSDWKDADFAVGANEIVYIPDTGELMLGSNVADTLEGGKASISTTYTKTGFEDGDIRPEMYFDCVDESNVNSANWITYTKEDQEINYTIAFNQSLNINTEASDFIDASVTRDIDELEEAVQAAIDAHDKYDKIESMMSEEQYSDTDSQEYLSSWLEAAQKECDYADANMQSVFSSGIGNFEDYTSNVVLAITDVGSKGDRLSLTKTRMAGQQTTFETLKSNNEDREISDIIIDYTSAYTAYEASLQAASKATSTTLLNYI